jgi:acyl carrier protein
MERAFVDIWQDLLGIDRIGVHDDFFEMGGHSLLATQLMSRLRETFLAELPLASIFDAPTVAELVRLAAESDTKPGRTEKIAEAVERVKTMSAGERQRLLDEARRAKSMV